MALSTKQKEINVKTKFGQLLAVVLLFVATIAIGTLPGLHQAQAAPPAAPTPVAAPDSVGAGRYFRFQPATAITADTNTGAVEVLNFETVDIEYTIDHGTVNTTTLKVQYSIEGDDWTDGATLVSASAADGAAVVARVPVFGRYMRVNQDVTNSNTITITLTAVGR